MNIKYTECSFEGCDKPHRRNGYCANHSQKFKRGTLYLEKKTKLCSIEECNLKHYCHNFCSKHYRQFKRQEMSKKVGEFQSQYEAGNINFEYKSIGGWSIALKRFFGSSCMICGWNEANCESHHIQPKSQSGKNTLFNGIVLCPNHHKLADIGKLSKEYLTNITNNKINSLVELGVQNVSMDH